MTTGKRTTRMMTAASSAAFIRGSALADGNLIAAPASAADRGAIPILNTTKCERATDGLRHPMLRSRRGFLGGRAATEHRAPPKRTRAAHPDRDRELDQLRARSLRAA